MPNLDVDAMAHCNCYDCVSFRQKLKETAANRQTDTEILNWLQAHLSEPFGRSDTSYVMKRAILLHSDIRRAVYEARKNEKVTP